MNVVVLQGRLSSPPRGRVLPSGDRLGSFEVTVRHPGERAETVPVVWLDPPEAVLGLAAGDEVVVVGRVRRRFYRAGRGTGSRTEVVADRLLPAAWRVPVLGLIDLAIADLVPEPVAVWAGGGGVDHDGADNVGNRMGTTNQ